MDTHSLQTFITVAEKQSFSGAAEHLYLTQPAISKRIASLESELNAKLFDRIGRKITLTEAGHALLSRAKSILLEMEDSRRLISNLAGQVSGRLSIGTSHHIGLHRLPPVLRQFTRDFPEVALDLQFMDSEVACRAVQSGDLEIGIVTLPLKPLHGLHSELIWPDPLDVVVGHEHSLAGQHKFSFKHLAEHPAILPSPGTYTRALLEKAFATRKQPLKVGMTTNYLETIKMMVGIGLGWSVLPRSMFGTELSTLNIRGLHLERQLGVVRHQARTLSNAASKMIDTLKSSNNN